MARRLLVYMTRIVSNGSHAHKSFPRLSSIIKYDGQSIFTITLNFKAQISQKAPRHKLHVRVIKIYLTRGTSVVGARGNFRPDIAALRLRMNLAISYKR